MSDHEDLGGNGNPFERELLKTERKKSEAAIARIGQLVRTQDNAITQDPVFMVQRCRRIYGMDVRYVDDCTWVHEDGGEEIDEEGRQVLEESWQTNGCTFIDGCHRVGYLDVWENVQPFFTRKGAEEYLRSNGHNLKGPQEPRIFVESGWRNEEWQMIRKFLAGCY
jgi:hypothetical protein